MNQIKYWNFSCTPLKDIQIWFAPPFYSRKVFFWGPCASRDLIWPLCQIAWRSSWGLDVNTKNVPAMFITCKSLAWRVSLFDCVFWALRATVMMTFSTLLAVTDLCCLDQLWPREEITKYDHTFARYSLSLLSFIPSDKSWVLFALRKRTKMCTFIFLHVVIWILILLFSASILWICWNKQGYLTVWLNGSHLILWGCAVKKKNQ